MKKYTQQTRPLSNWFFLSAAIIISHMTLMYGAVLLIFNLI